MLSALERIGWRVKRTAGSHRVPEREGWADIVFAFHDGQDVGPPMLARISKASGLKPDDL